MRYREGEREDITNLRKGRKEGGGEGTSLTWTNGRGKKKSTAPSPFLESRRKRKGTNATLEIRLATGKGLITLRATMTKKEREEVGVVSARRRKGKKKTCANDSFCTLPRPRGKRGNPPLVSLRPGTTVKKGGKGGPLMAFVRPSPRHKHRGGRAGTAIPLTHDAVRGKREIGGFIRAMWKRGKKTEKSHVLPCYVGRKKEKGGKAHSRAAVTSFLTIRLGGEGDVMT